MSLEFTIEKSFGKLTLEPSRLGVVFKFIPTNPQEQDSLYILLPLSFVGNFLIAARAYFFELENSVFSALFQSGNNEIIVKLYHNDGSIWLRLIAGDTDRQRIRVRLNARDLLVLEAVAQATVDFNGTRGISTTNVYNASNPGVINAPLTE